MAAESWPETVKTIEKFLEEGAESVKEMSGVSIKKEVKMALKEFRKTFKDLERFRDRKTGEYDIPAMTEHLNSFVPGTIPYAKVQMEAAKKAEKKEERKEKMMDQVRNKSKGGFLKIDGLKPYSAGGVLTSIMRYFTKGRKSKQASSPPTLIPMPVPKQGGGAMQAAPPPPAPTPPLPMVMGSTDQEVMSSFLLNELGKS